jgi:hypothetical protein
MTLSDEKLTGRSRDLDLQVVWTGAYDVRALVRHCEEQTVRAGTCVQ